jgi:hypothetical protein
MKIRTLIDRIQTQDIVLPEFQREYVWKLDLAKELMVSLYKEYPIGSILIWETQDPPELKGFDSASRKEHGTYQVILDGQQRLTTLYMLINDSIPPYYKKAEIENDPRQLYFNLKTGEFRYYQVTRMELDKAWVSVKDVFLKKVDAAKIAMEMAPHSPDEIIKLVSAFSSSHQCLLNIAERDIPVLNIPTSARVNDAIDVFDRVNSKGTKLTEAELALAHISGCWTNARREMKALINKLAEKGFIFDLSFTVRCLTAATRWRGELSTIHTANYDQLIAGWEKVTRALEYLTELLPAHAYIHGTDDLNTLLVLIPLVAIIVKQGGSFTSELEIKHALHWLYAAHMWQRYTSQTDQRLDHDVSIIANYDYPYDKLEKEIVQQRGRLEVKPGDLVGRSTLIPFYRMAQVVAKYNKGVDWFNGLPLARSVGKTYSLESHHIFPVSRLYDEGGYDGNNHLHRKIVNEIANRVFLTGKSNKHIGNQLPDEYLPSVIKRYPNALAAQFVPTKKNLWKLRNYEKFLEERRHLIAEAINEFMDSLITAPLKPSKLTVEDLIQRGEGPTIEFKSTLRYDLRRKTTSPDLEKAVIKTFAGFFNSEGGTLLIGVADDGEVVGIEKDLETLGKENEDGFELKLTELVGKYLTEIAQPYFTVEFTRIKGSMVCRINLDQSPDPVFLQDGDRKYFYIRPGNSTRSLDMDEAHQYIAQHWTS